MNPDVYTQLNINLPVNEFGIVLDSFLFCFLKIISLAEHILIDKGLSYVVSSNRKIMFEMNGEMQRIEFYCLNLMIV